MSSSIHWITEEDMLAGQELWCKNYHWGSVTPLSASMHRLAASKTTQNRPTLVGLWNHPLVFWVHHLQLMLHKLCSFGSPELRSCQNFITLKNLGQGQRVKYQGKNHELWTPIRKRKSIQHQMSVSKWRAWRMWSGAHSTETLWCYGWSVSLCKLLVWLHKV